MTFEAGLRRSPAPDAAPGHDPELVGRIRSEIEATEPITFARFMERALYEPGLGYYRRARPGPGRRGDFLTAPETHPIFGRIVARQVVDAWERIGWPARFVVREHGAGEGALAVPLLDGIAAEAPALADAVRYQPVEIDDRRTAALAERLRVAGHGDRLDLDPADDAIDGIVLANEVLDALPVHRVTVVNGELRELLVDWRDGRFVEVAAPPSTPALARRLADVGVILRDGQVAEINLALEPWINDVAASIARGALLVIDYGHPAAELYGPRRPAGTLVGYVGHRVSDDPFANVGRQDLTAHVDVDAVTRRAVAAGLVPLGSTSQAEFLVSLGAEEVVDAIRSDPATTLEEWTALRSAVMRLLDPAATGAFRVLAFGRRIDPEPPLRGFRFRLGGRPASSVTRASPQ